MTEADEVAAHIRRHLDSHSWPQTLDDARAIVRYYMDDTDVVIDNVAEALLNLTQRRGDI